MKRLFFVTSLLALFAIAHGQDDSEKMRVKHAPRMSNTHFSLEFGPRIGANYSMVSGIDGAQGIIGFVGGGTIEFRTSRMFSLSLDLVYSAKGFFVQSNENKVVISYIDAPLTANVYLTERFSVKVGVQPSLLMAATRFTRERNFDEKSSYQQFDLAIPVGLSYNIGWGFNADLRYNLGLMNIVKTEGQNVKNSAITLTLTKKFN